MAYVIKVGDLLPPMIGSITDEGGTVDLSNADKVEMHLDYQGVKGDDGVLVKELEVLDQVMTRGLARCNWSEGETDIPGEHKVTFVVTWPDEAPQTFPNEGHHLITFERRSDD